MAANRKKGKKPQNSNLGNSTEKKGATAAAAPASDNAAGNEADTVSVNWETAAPSTDAEKQPQAGSTGAPIPLSPPSTTAPASVDGPALNSETESVSATINESSDAVDSDSSAASESGSAATETDEKTVSEPNISDASATSQSKIEATETSTEAQAEGSAAIPAGQGDTVEPPSSGENAETVANDQPKVKLSTASDTETTAAPPTVAQEDLLNFKKDEIRTLLVPVKPFNRMISCIIVIVTFSILGYTVLKTPAGLNAQGMHTIDLPDAGDYVFFFRGDIQDAYGWKEDGRFRQSLQIDMEPIEPFQKVEKIEPIKDLSGAGFFTVAEFEVNQPGNYNLWIKWNDPSAKCMGKIHYEKDPVEIFFFKWALGIVGTIAFFYMVGIPMTTRKAQSTLPNSSPPVVTK